MLCYALTCLLAAALSTLTVAWGAELPATQAQDRQYTLGILTQREPNDPFWGVVEDIMAEACQQLGLKIRRYHAYSNQRNMIKAVDQAAEDGVDVLVFPNFRESVPDILAHSRQRHLPVYLFNADVNPPNRGKVGAPREKYPLWLGRLMPDDKQAGYILAKTLIEHVLEKDGGSPETLEITGLTGTLVETPASDRVEGLYRAAGEYKNVRVDQVVHAFWEEELAYNKTQRLLERYPETRILWSASDIMALGAVRALEETGRTADVVLGGIDWTVEGVQAVQAGTLTTTVGGHVADGAWIAVMLYDYLHGRDFAEDSTDMHLPMLPFPTQDSYAENYLQRISQSDWTGVDFRQFSKVLNPDIRCYGFNASVLYLPAGSHIAASDAACRQ